MKIWIIATGEPLPNEERLHRAGQIAHWLAAKGHTVTWWTSRFNHQKKCHRDPCALSEIVISNLRIVALESNGYQRNVSLQRIKDHWELAKRWSRHVRSEQPPDVIHCAYPTIDLAYEAALYGVRRSVPTVLDVRDMWPDIFAQQYQGVKRWMVRHLVSPLTYRARIAFKSALFISGHTPGYVKFGLRYAAREKHRLDRDFPFTYPVEPMTKARSRGTSLVAQTLATERALYKVRVAFAGDMSTEHNGVRLVEAVTELSRCGEIQTVLCGGGVVAEKIKSLKLRNVKCVGWVAKEELSQIYEECDLGLLPYQPTIDFAESIPNKAVDYLAHGLHIVNALNPSYISSLLFGTGVLVNYDASVAGSLSDAVRRWAEQMSTRRLSKSDVRKMHDEKFDHGTVMNSTETWLQQVATFKPS